MVESNVKWIKIKVGMFDGESFKRIKRAKIGGEKFRDKLTAVWFELLDLGAKCNNDGFLVSNEIAYKEFEDIAIMLDRETNEIELCMNFYISNNMIEVIDDCYKLSNWDKYQNTTELERIKENNRERYKRWYEKKKNENLTLGQTLSNVKPNEKDSISYSISNNNILYSLDYNNNNNNIYNSSNNISNTNTNNNSNSNNSNNNKKLKQEIIDYLNKKTNKNFKITNKETEKHINARLKDGYVLEEFKKVIDKKTEEWLGTDMDTYLRPSTLFGSKFESYLNSNTKKEQEKNIIENDETFI